MLNLKIISYKPTPNNNKLQYLTRFRHQIMTQNQKKKLHFFLFNSFHFELNEIHLIIINPKYYQNLINFEFPNL